MSFSSPDAPSGGAPTKQNFGDRVGSYFEKAFPVAGGLAHLALGGGGQPQPQPSMVMNSGGSQLPDMSLPTVTQPDYSTMLAQGATPKKSGISDFLKSLMGA